VRYLLALGQFINGENQMKTKCLAVGIILLFVGTCIIPAIAQDTEKTSSRGNWLYVGGSGPGNYTRIQDAVDNASDGYTVFVYDDSSPYYEEIEIEKSINLIGENHNTVIDGMNEMDTGITIPHDVDFVSINCFSIINFDYSGVVVYGENVSISNIYFINNLFGLSSLETKNNVISNNLFQDCQYCGICLYKTSNHLIGQNDITGCEEGIAFYLSSLDDTISNNEITKNTIGIDFEAFSESSRDKSIKNTIVQYNNITDNSIGIKIFGKFNNGVIKNNNFIENDISISYKIFFFQKLRINANFWGETKLLPKSIPGYFTIFLGSYAFGEHQDHQIFLNLPKIIFDWNPAQESYDIPRMS
jgi:parallel beta-helix repeat protein